ncbi:MAG: 16S rRNA (cytosine(1402)-N(4))-methyltransferase RsmH [Planctomycetales bacterium]|nr:16S rRNA (cytosine(1402)-N(4))-methyltransferase RsmH [Planctomycetales bacterium]
MAIGSAMAANGSTVHVPVLAAEVLEALDPQPGQTIVDGTLGGGGHARLLASRLGTSGRLIGLDRDPQAVARQRAAPPCDDRALIDAHQANFRDLDVVLQQLGVDRVDAVLVDIGLSSDQLADTERGFSFTADGPLDLRFDPTDGQPAADIVATLPEKELADLIYQYGEERFSRRIARRICETRRDHRIETAQELAELVRRCIPHQGGRGKPRIDPATRTFQALRIAVNDELGALAQFLDVAPRCVVPGGRVAVISFHSLEDRIVKHTFRDDARYVVQTRRPLRAQESEIAANPRARSARLRVAQVAGDVTAHGLARNSPT